MVTSFVMICCKWYCWAQNHSKKLFLQGSIDESKATVVYFKVFSKAIDIVSKVNSFLPYVWYRCFETCVRFGIRVCIARLQVLHKFRIGATEILAAGVIIRALGRGRPSDAEASASRFFGSILVK